MQTINCSRCDKIFAKWSIKSTQILCRDCELPRTSKSNTQVASANSELSKKEILKKLDMMENDLKAFKADAKETIAKLMVAELKKHTLSFEEKIVGISNASGLAHSAEFKELKTSIEAAQVKHEQRMKTLLATVNTRSIEALNKAEKEYEKLGKRVKELRMLAKQEGWKITSSKSND